MFYNFYVGLITVAFLPYFMYDLVKIYWTETEFEYGPNSTNIITAIVGYGLIIIT